MNEPEIKCPSCHRELTEIGQADSGQNNGGWFECQHCGEQFISLDSDGTLSEYRPLPVPKMTMDLGDNQ